MKRIKVLRRRCEAHLGYVLDEDLLPTGVQYCTNSAALHSKKIRTRLRHIHVIRVLSRVTRAVIFLLCASSITQPCLAQDGNRGEWVVAGYLGGAHTASSSVRISQPTLGTNIEFKGVRYDGQSFDPPLYYGYRVGYFMPRVSWLGVEAEFIHLKVFSDPQQHVQATGTHRGVFINRELPLGQIVQEYSISHGVNLLLFNLVGRYRVHRGPAHPRGRFILAGRFGLGPTIPHTESRIDGQPQQQYEVGRLGWQGAGGAEIHVWRGLYVLGEYKFTRTRQHGKIFAGEARSLLRSHHSVLGLSYHF